jgi:hypothetical protein
MSESAAPHLSITARISAAVTHATAHRPSATSKAGGEGCAGLMPLVVVAVVAVSEVVVGWNVSARRTALPLPLSLLESAAVSPKLERRAAAPLSAAAAVDAEAEAEAEVEVVGSGRGKRRRAAGSPSTGVGMRTPDGVVGGGGEATGGSDEAAS